LRRRIAEDGSLRGAHRPRGIARIGVRRGGVIPDVTRCELLGCGERGIRGHLHLGACGSDSADRERGGAPDVWVMNDGAG
jgi:hypothetical protein